MGKKTKILITVKTYPQPSESYLELVCTAGVRENGEFVRLYPIDYRYKPYWEWYKKYQWIEVEIEKNTRDPRPESYRPVPNAKIRTLGEPLPTKNNWEQRKRYILARDVPTMCGLPKLSQKQCSLSIIRPGHVSEFVAEPDDRNWKPKQEASLRQHRLFGPQQKPLEKFHTDFHIFLSVRNLDALAIR